MKQKIFSFAFMCSLMLLVTSCFDDDSTAWNNPLTRITIDGIESAYEKTAYVGDRSIDVMCARNAGVQAILFLPEGSPVEATGQENRIIRDLTELLYSRQGKKK